MAYSYLDADDSFVGHGPSIGGACAMFDEIRNKASKGAYPALNKLLTSGECEDLTNLKGEALRLMTHVTDKDVKDSLMRLARAASLAKGKVVLSY